MSDITLDHITADMDGHDDRPYWDDVLQEHPSWKKFMKICESGQTHLIPKFVEDTKMPELVITRALSYFISSHDPIDLEVSSILISCGGDLADLYGMNYLMLDYIIQDEKYDAYKLLIQELIKHDMVDRNEIKYNEYSENVETTKKFLKIYDDIKAGGNLIKPVK